MYTSNFFPEIVYQSLISIVNCRAHRILSPCEFILASVCLFGRRGKNMPSCLSARPLLVVLNRLFNHSFLFDKPQSVVKYSRSLRRRRFSLEDLKLKLCFPASVIKFRYVASGSLRALIKKVILYSKIQYKYLFFLKRVEVQLQIKGMKHIISS
jgi:hypothetical protein